MAYGFGGPRMLWLVLMMAITAYYGIRILRRSIRTLEIALILSFLVQVVMIRYYRGERYFGYLQYFIPYLVFFLASFFYSMFRIPYLRWVGVFMAMMIFLLSAQSVYRSFSSIGINHDTRVRTREIYDRFPFVNSFRILGCKGSISPEIQAVVLLLTMDGRYSQDGFPIGFSGGCFIPDEALLPQPVIPLTILDLHRADPDILVQTSWIEVSPESIYQSSARWWMDEQP